MLSSFEFIPRPALYIRAPVLYLLLVFFVSVEPCRAELGLSVPAQTLPQVLDRSRDVRWAEEGIFLAVSGQGVVHLGFDPASQQVDVSSLRWITRDGDGRDQVWLSSRLGVGESHLVIGAPLWVLGWLPPEAKGLAGKSYFFEGIEDLDVYENRVGVLGLRRGDDGTMAPEGYIAWAGALGDGQIEFEPVLISTAGPGARPMESCASFTIGAIRFLPDGSLVVAPGAESGVYRYGAKSQLLGMWETGPLQIGVDCDFDETTRDFYARDPHARWAYLNEFQTVDEILVVDGRPVLVVRSVHADGTRWHAVVLEKLGAFSQRRLLPLSSPSDLAHVRGDVRDGEVVFLVFDDAILLDSGDPRRSHARQPKLVVMPIPPSLRAEPVPSTPQGDRAK